MPDIKSGSPTGFMVIELSVKLPVKVPDEAVWLSELYTGFVCAFEDHEISYEVSYWGIVAVVVTEP